MGSTIFTAFCKQAHGVSVVIPAFNAAKYIRQALDSVFAQTYQALEVIVVDDGSSDGTSAIVEQFITKDSRIQLVRQSNAGVGAARNAGIRKAHGKYIAVLDADDWWFPDKLEKQVGRIEQCGSETGIVYCWSTLVDQHGDFLCFSEPYTLEGRLSQVLVLRNVICNASTPLIRAAALEKVGLYLTRAEQGGGEGCEDWDLSLRIAEIFSIRLVPEYLVAYRQTNSGMSSKSERMVRSYNFIVLRTRQRNRNLPAAAFCWSAGYFYLYIEDKCYNRGCYWKCLRYLKDAVCANPILLIKTGTYRRFFSILLKIVTGATGNGSTEQGRSLFEKKRSETDLNSKRRRKRPFISNRVFKCIEDARWSAALRDRA